MQRILYCFKDCKVIIRLMWIQDELPLLGGKFLFKIRLKGPINRPTKSDELSDQVKHRPVFTSRRIIRRWCENGRSNGSITKRSIAMS